MEELGTIYKYRMQLQHEYNLISHIWCIQKKISNQAAFKGMKMAVIFMNNLDLIREAVKRATGQKYPLDTFS